MASASGCLQAMNHRIQPVQPLEPAWPLAGDLRGPCRLRGSAAHRHGGQHLARLQQWNPERYGNGTIEDWEITVFSEPFEDLLKT